MKRGWTEDLLSVIAGVMIYMAASYYFDRHKQKKITGGETEADTIAKRKRMPRSSDFGGTTEGCCITCEAERSRRNKARNNDGLQEDVKHHDQVQVSEVDVVDLRLHKHQVVITVNAPPGFRLSLDFLPCFQGPVVFLPQQKPAAAAVPRILTRLLLPKEEEPKMEEEPKIEDPFQNGLILGSSNGLLLCSTTRGRDKEWGQTQYYLCNPLTKDWIALPPTPKSVFVTYLGFVFDPCPDFGHGDLHGPLPCSNACRFKVVRMPWTFLHFEVEIFCSEVGQWEAAKLSSSGNQPPTESGSVFHNGRLHWLSRGCIAVYDPYNNKLHGTIPPPKKTQYCLISGFHGPRLCRGSLWMFQVSHYSLYLRLWELKGYDELGDNGELNLEKCYWKPHRLVDLAEIIGDDVHCVNMLAMHPHDPDIVYLEMDKKDLINKGRETVCCNLRTKTVGQPMLERTMGARDDVLTLVFPST